MKGNTVQHFLYFILLSATSLRTACSEVDSSSPSSSSSSLSSYSDVSSSCSSTLSVDGSCPAFDEFLTCGDGKIQLNKSVPVVTVHAPPLSDDNNRCLKSLSCIWFITSDPGLNIYVQIRQLKGKYTKSVSYEDEIVIGEGSDYSNGTSILAHVGLYYGPDLDDGRVYIVKNSLAWVKVSAHGPGVNRHCIGFEFSFTQREEQGFCETGATLCTYSSVCLPSTAFCDAFVDCGDYSDQVDCDICGNTSIQLIPGSPSTITYAGSWTGTSAPPKTDCFWLLTAPEDHVIEINTLATNVIGPRISVGSVAEGVIDASERLFTIEKGEVTIVYTNVTSIWMAADISSIVYYRRTVYEIKITAYKKQECGPDEFQCQSQQCVAARGRCDGVPDCPAHEDEYGCGVNCSSHDEYLCPSKPICISSKQVCNGLRDCSSYADEFDCGRCGDTYIDLRPNQPIRISQPVDISVDCVWLITTSSNESQIRVDFLNFPISELQDGYEDYHIARLKFGYGHSPIDGIQRNLFSSLSYPRVLTFRGPAIWIVLDVKSSKPYFDTPGRLILELDIGEYIAQDCNGSQFSCSSGLLCIDRDKVCDGKQDCPESDDEFDCGCGVDKFKCSSGTECVETTWLCDGLEDCTDRSDEAKCGPCGDSVIELSFRPYFLTSIGYPKNYPPNTYCVWFVLGKPGYDIVVVFHDFRTEELFDRLSVRNDTYGLQVSGHRYPERISLYSYKLKLYFRSDYLYRYTGFNVSLQQHEMASCGVGEVACNDTVSLICILELSVCDSTGDCPDATDEKFCGDICGETAIELGRAEYELVSPLYQRGIYPEDTVCVWAFDTSAREKIKLQIDEFDLEQNYDYLSIGLGNDSVAGTAASLTGTTKLSQIWFESSQIWVKLTTDVSVSGRGFSISLIAVDKEMGIDCSGRCPHNELVTLCLRPGAYCDGIADCTDGSDEKGCANLNCSLDMFECQGKQQCLLWESVCDGTVDCKLFHDDEEQCHIYGCPPGCDCLKTDEGLHVKCIQGWNSSTVDQLVKITAVLELTGGNMISLDEGLFKRLGSLRTLYLRNNNISSIKQNAFIGLKNLVSLDISENNISELTGGMFSHLPMLTDLGIRSVPVQYIKARAFDGLKGLQQLVLMRGNGHSNQPTPYEKAIRVAVEALSDLQSLQKLYVDDHRLCCDFQSVLKEDGQCVNIELQSPLFNCGRLMPNTVLQVFMWILGFSALIGNAIVIVWRIREDSGKGSKYVHSFLVLNLAMSDFLMGVYMVIIATTDAIKREDYYLEATQWRNSALCKAAGVISVLSSEASVFFITLISIDRYLCIVHPFSRVRLREKSVWVSAASIWIASLLVSLVPTIVVSSDSDVYGLSDVCIGLPLLTRPVGYTFKEADTVGGLGNDTYLIPQPIGSKPSWSYSIVLFLGVNFICFLVITVSYTAVFTKVKRSIRRVKQRAHKEEEIKMATKMAIIVGSDCLCWMPVILLGILSQTSVIQIKPDAYAWLVVFILPINSSLNPYLYTIVTVISRKRQAHLLSLKSSQRPKVYSIPDIQLEEKKDSGCWTTTTPVATPTGSINHELIK